MIKQCFRTNAVIVATFLAVALVLANTSSADHLVEVEQRFNENRQKWDTLGIENYDFRMQRSCFCTPDYVQPGIVHVRGGQIDSVEHAVSGVALNEMAFLTVDGLFDRAQASFDSHVFALTAAFDTTLGYPTELSIDGREFIADDEMFFTAGELRVVPETIFFLVAERPGEESHNDSYVLPLNDPTDISYARRLIDEGPGIGAAIVVADIAAGADGINRDLLAAGKPEWSWHVSEFTGFADATIEILDGWPGYIEDDVPRWMNNTNGQIGFWGYTVVRELGVDPDRIPGDANGDKKVTRADFFIVADHYGATSGGTFATGDFNEDGATSMADLVILQSNFGRKSVANSAAVPEPSSIVLLLLAMVVVLKARSTTSSTPTA